MKLFLTLILFIKNTYSSSFDFQKYDLKVLDNIGGEKIEMEFKDAVANGKYFRIDFKSINSKALFNNKKVNKIVVSPSKRLATVVLADDVDYNGIFFPKDTTFSDDDRVFPKYAVSNSTTEMITFKNIKFQRNEAVALHDNGSFSIGFAGENSNSEGFSIVLNQPVVFNDKGQLIKAGHIVTNGRKYSFSIDWMTIKPHLVSNGEYGEWVEFKITSKGLFLGNKCDNCLYTLCLKNDHFYVYRIQNIKPGDVIQGKAHKNKNVWGYFYENGESTKPYEDIKDDEDEPFIDRCTFKSSHEETK